MLYVFLDVDGVLNVKTGEPGYKDVSMYTVRRFVEALEGYEDVKIVLTSEWRKWFLLPDYCEGYLKSLQNYLRKYGLEVYDKTEKIDYATRELEIQSYVKKKKIKNYIILDDQKHQFSFDNKELYLVDGKTGFTKDDVEKFQKKCFALYEDSLYEKEKKPHEEVDWDNFFEQHGFWSPNPKHQDGMKLSLKATEQYEATGTAFVRHLRGKNISEIPGVKDSCPEYDGMKVVGLSVWIEPESYDAFVDGLNAELMRVTPLDDVREVLLFQTGGGHECNSKFGL